MNHARPFVLLDRDGTLIVEKHYLADPEQVELLPRTTQALALLSRLGFGLAVVTNQSGVARGYFSEARLAQIHARLEALLAAAGVVLDGIYVCPHAPEAGCACRKPSTGLVAQAAREHGFDPAAAIVVGDKPRDIELGRRIGALTILVQTGYGARYSAGEGARPDVVVEDLFAAAQYIAATRRKSIRATA